MQHASLVVKPVKSHDFLRIENIEDCGRIRMHLKGLVLASCKFPCVFIDQNIAR